MQADVNKTKSRCYNYFLRHFHEGLRILTVIFCSQLSAKQQHCSELFSKFILPLAIALTVLNLAFIIYFECKSNFPRCQFFLFFSVNIVTCSVMGLLTFGYQNNDSTCQKNLINHRYVVLEIVVNVFVCLYILLAKFQWAQRYTNTPGNVVWTIIIISFAKDMSFVTQIQVVAWIVGAISVASFTINAISLVTGITSFIKKSIFIEWIVSLILLVVCILIMLMVFFNNYYSSKYSHKILSDICLKFILVSTIDLGFWIWGLLTLSYQNGDFVRNAILYSNYGAYSKQQKQHEVQPNFNERGYQSITNQQDINR